MTHQIVNEGIAIIERDTVVVSGPEAVSYLHSQVSNDVDDMAIGDARWSFVLQPQGKVDGFFRMVRLDDQLIRIDTDSGFGQSLADSLARFKLRTKVDFEVGHTSVARIFGATSVAAARDKYGDDAISSPWLGEAVDVFDVDAEVAGDVAVDPSALEALRVAFGMPAMGTEIKEDTIPNETDLVDLTVSFSKGCYRGQELVERIHSRGAKRRLLRRVASKNPLQAGDAVEAADDEGNLTEVGKIETAVAAGENFVGFAYLAGRVEPGAEARVGTGPVEVKAVF